MEIDIIALILKKHKFFLEILKLTYQEKTTDLEFLQNSINRKKIFLSCIKDIDIQLKQNIKAPREQAFLIEQKLEDLESTILKILELDSINQTYRKKKLLSKKS